MKRPFRFHALAIAPGVYQFIRQKGLVEDRVFEIEFLGPAVQTFSFAFVK